MREMRPTQDRAERGRSELSGCFHRLEFQPVGLSPSS